MANLGSLGLEPVLTTRYFWVELGILFESWVKNKEISGEYKSGKKESIFPKATHKGWKNPLIQLRVVESLKN